MKMLVVAYSWREMSDPATGEVRRCMVPQDRYRKTAERQFVDGESYPLQIVETRSRKSHDHFFASVHDAYLNLPEKVQARWLNENHMRKWTLVELGLYDEKEVEFETEKDAKKFAMMYRQWDERLPVNDRDYARLWVVGTKVIIRTAKSQSAAAMGKDAFQASKKAVLDNLEDFIGVSRGALTKNAGRAA